jgi:hypothetical protein
VILNDKRDDATPVPEIGERRAGDGARGGKDGASTGKKRVPLEDITRFTMVKRIW